MPVAPRDGRALIVTQPQIVTAKDVLRTQMTGVDGKLTTEWPSGRRYTQEGHRYDITMAGEPVNYVSMSASHTGAVQLVSGGEGRVVMERTTGDPFVTRALLDEPITSDSAHVTRMVNDEDSRHDGAMSDLQLLQVATEQVSDAPEGRPLMAAAPDDLGDEWRTIKGEHPAEDPRPSPLAMAQAPGKRSRCGRCTWSRTHSPSARACPDSCLTLDGVRSAGDTACHLQLMHPLNYTRRAMIVDFRVGQGDGPVQIVLDPRDLVVEPGGVCAWSCSSPGRSRGRRLRWASRLKRHRPPTSR